MPCTRRRALLVPLLLLLVAAVSCTTAWGGSSPPPAPRFAVVPASHVREGKGRMETLEEQASDEGFLDRVFGTNCFSQAVGELTADCRRMQQEDKTRLALRLMNCQLATQGSSTYPCHRRQSLKECTDALSDRAHSLFVEFLTHADSMCLFIQNQNFEKYTENMLNRLSEGAGLARQELAEAAKRSAALSKDTVELGRKAEAALGLLRQHGELEEEQLKLARKMREESLSYYLSLDAQQQQALELQDQALTRQAALEEGQTAVLQQVAEAKGHLAGLFDVVEGRAAELAAASARQAEAQRALAGELGALTDSSAGIRGAVDVVLHYQQRSDSVLMRLLGKSYSLEDVAFYVAGALAALAAGISPATAKAKVPVLALLGVSLLGERILLDRLHMWMDVGEGDEVVLSLPVPPLLSWFPMGLTPAGAAGAAGAAMWQFGFKWAVRRVAVAVGAAILLYSALSHQDYEREGYRLLRKLEEDQQRRHDEYVALVNRHRIELAALLGGARGGGDNDGHNMRGGTAQKQGAGGAGAAVVGGAPAAHLQQAGQMVAVGGAGVGGRGGRRVLRVTEEWSEEEEVAGVRAASEDEQQHSMRAAADHPGSRQPRQAPQPAAAAANGVSTPFAKERGRQTAGAAAPPARPSSAPHRKAPAGRKRTATDVTEPDVTSGGAGKRHKGASRRRSSASEEPPTGMEKAAGSNLGKRGRLGQANPGTALAVVPAAAPKRARRS